MGTAAAAVLAATAWAGGILGSVSGLSWADDFDPDAAGESAGIARLAWWVGLAAFFTAGGQLAVVGGLIDSVRHVPIGTAFGGPPEEWLVTLAVTTPAVALSLAVMLAMPALVAVVAFHLASAICLRAIPFATGPGLLQGLASLVLLASIWLGAESWGGGSAIMMLRSIDACFGER
jgi:flagellar biosynthesis protein FliR